LPDAEKTAEAEALVIDTVNTLLERRGAVGIKVTPQSRLTADLDLDSLELAELSAVLEDELGRDPFSEGILPETIAELVGFYDQ
jgi:acyl carrier protein